MRGAYQIASEAGGLVRYWVTGSWPSNRLGQSINKAGLRCGPSEVGLLSVPPPLIVHRPIKITAHTSLSGSYIHIYDCRVSISLTQLSLLAHPPSRALPPLSLSPSAPLLSTGAGISPLSTLPICLPYRAAPLPHRMSSSVALLPTI